MQILWVQGLTPALKKKFIETYNANLSNPVILRLKEILDQKIKENTNSILNQVDPSNQTYLIGQTKAYQDILSLFTEIKR